jgi:hypothetical protein
MKKFALILALTLLPALLPACASTSAGDYFTNRGADLVDILRIHGAAGRAVAVKVDAFRMFHFGIGWEATPTPGVSRTARSPAGARRSSPGASCSATTARRSNGTSENRVSGSYGWTFGEKGNGFQVADPGNWLDLLSVRGTAMVGIGLDVELRFGEVIDFLAGIFQFDPAGDDVAVSKMRTDA